MTSNLQNAIDHFDRHKNDYLETLQEWLRIPSISTEPDRATDMHQAAEWAATYLRNLGFLGVELVGPESHPAVIGEMTCGDPDAPTALMYGHYDVQPTTPNSEWQSAPFEPEIRGEHLFGRGTADMKGPAFSALCALETLSAVGAVPNFSIKVLLEGEEEIGSPNLAELIAENREALSSDFCLNPDAGMLGPQTPTLSTATRGLVSFDLQVSGPTRDLHSGEFGGAIHNPAQALCELVAGLHDSTGRVTLPGFYDRVRNLDEAERETLRSLPNDEIHFLEQSGAPALWGEADYAVQERVGSRPTLDVHGISSGFNGAGSKTILPAVATAKLSTRLVPDQNPDEIRRQLEAHLRLHAPQSICWELDQLASSPPAESRLDSRWSRRMAGALGATWGCSPLANRIGGTIPIVGLLQDVLDMDSVNIGWALPDGNLHAADENLHLPTFYRGVEALIRFFGEPLDTSREVPRAATAT
jgi:acetylornithine deacetylase/succinyl-diaminopimelate desuccinylase-like protein